MDRNFVPFDVIRPAIVALRKESVDRNSTVVATLATLVTSLSARRAWIEMLGWLRTLEVTRSRSPQGERG